MESQTTTATAYESPVGDLVLVSCGERLLAVLWQDYEPHRAALETPPAVAGQDTVLATAAHQLDEYFAGTRTSFELPLELRGTSFQVAAWRALAEIPFGETRTYAEQAARLGRPKAFRAVGAANGRNPLSIVLPCHRVIGSDGLLTGFGGGLDAKRALLEHERAVAAASSRVRYRARTRSR